MGEIKGWMLDNPHCLNNVLGSKENKYSFTICRGLKISYFV